METLEEIFMAQPVDKARYERLGVLSPMDAIHAWIEGDFAKAMHPQ